MSAKLLIFGIGFLTLASVGFYLYLNPLEDDERRRVVFRQLSSPNSLPKLPTVDTSTTALDKTVKVIFESDPSLDPKEVEAKKLFDGTWKRYLHLREAFDDSYKRAVAGDADAMLDVRNILPLCMDIADVGSKDKIHEIFDSISRPNLEILDLMTSQMLFKFEDCQYVLSHQPADVGDVFEWGAVLLADAKKTGNVVAELIFLDDEEWGEENFVERMGLLENAFQVGSPKVFFQAVRLAIEYQMINEDYSAMHIHMWNLLSCKHDSYCDEAQFRSVMSNSLLPSDLEVLDSAVVRFEERMNSNLPINLGGTFSGPLLRVDNSMSFEPR
jgi:hypothetical protein